MSYVIFYTQLVLICVFGYKNATINAPNNGWVNAARARQIEGSNWNVIIDNEDTNGWNFWGTIDGSNWGFNASIPSRFILTIHGETISTNNCELLISFKDRYFRKHFSMNIQLDGVGDNIIGPACDNVHNPITPFFIHENQYYTSLYDAITDTNLTALNVSRKCRTFWSSYNNECEYDIMSSALPVNPWSLTFIIDNNPINDTTTVTFEANGQSSVSCGFADSFTPEAGLDFYMSASENGQHYAVNQMDFAYYKISDAPTTQMPTTNTPTTFAPTTLIPTTKVPSTNIPTTYRPTMYAPTAVITSSLSPTTTTLNERGVTDGTSIKLTKYLEKIGQSTNDQLLVVIIIVVIVLVLVICVAIILYYRKIRQKQFEHRKNRMQTEIEAEKTDISEIHHAGITASNIVTKGMGMNDELADLAENEFDTNAKTIGSVGENNTKGIDEFKIDTLVNANKDEIVIGDDEIITEGQNQVEEFVVQDEESTVGQTFM